MNFLTRPLLKSNKKLLLLALHMERKDKKTRKERSSYCFAIKFMDFNCFRNVAKGSIKPLKFILVSRYKSTQHKQKGQSYIYLMILWFYFVYLRFAKS